MTAASVTQLEPREIAPAQADQLYVTHCLPADSVSNRPGFGVRATSVDDAAVQDFARMHFSYELPAGHKRRPSVAPEEAPCRLALLQGPGGRAILGHTAYVADDTRGRKNSYFSHVLVYPSRGPSPGMKEALACWASPDWTTEYRSGATRKLDPLPGPPRPGSVNDAALTAFLSGKPGIDSPLASLIRPPRLSDKANERQQLLRLVLQGVRMVLADPAARRARLYLVAEPGLTALLLHGVARLLPEARVKAITFSTYEPNDLSLREFRLAQIVGTYSGTDDTLDADYFSARGYAIDTFTLKRSDELTGDLPKPLLDALELAAEGEWELLEKCCLLLGKRFYSEESLQRVRDGLRAKQRFLDTQEQHLRDKEEQLRDIELLDSFDEGRELVERYPEQVWPVIRGPSLTSERLQVRFSGLLRQHMELDLVPETSKAIGGPQPGDWLPHWERLQSLLAAEPARRMPTFLKVLEGAGEIAGDFAARRLPLLQKWVQLAGPPNAAADPPPRVTALLTPKAGTDLEQLAQWQQCPRPLLARALCDGLKAEATKPTALSLLDSSDSELQRAFCAAVRQLHDEELVWKLLQDRSLKAAVFGPLFSEELRKQEGAILQMAVEGVNVGELSKWQHAWELLRLAHKNEAARVRPQLEKVLQTAGGDRITGELLQALVREWLRLAGGSRAAPPQMPACLLAARTPEDVEALSRLGLAEPDLTTVLVIALKKSETSAAARSVLRTGTDTLFGCLCRHAENCPAPEEKKTLLLALLKESAAQDQEMLGRVLQHKLKVSAELMEQLLAERDGYSAAWRPFWADGGRLEHVLSRLGGLRKSILAIRISFSRQLTGEVLVPGDLHQQKVLAALAKVCGQIDVTKSTKDEMDLLLRVNAWGRLRNHLENPETTTDEDLEELRKACQLVGLHAPKLLVDLREYMLARNLYAPAGIERLLAIFGGFYSRKADPKQALNQWAGLVKSFPSEFREAALCLYITREFLVKDRPALARRLHEAGLVGSEFLIRLQKTADEAQDLPVSEEVPSATGTPPAAALQLDPNYDPAFEQPKTVQPPQAGWRGYLWLILPTVAGISLVILLLVLLVSSR